MTFSLRLFGPPVIEGKDEPLNGRAAQRHRLALLALLSASPGHQLSRDKLLAYVWPESDTERARHLLNVSAHVLRQELGEEALMSVGDDLRLATALLTSDVAEFEEALSHGDAERAVELYAAPFLDGFYLSGATEFEHWVDAERARLASLYERALESLAVEAEAGEDAEAAVKWWRQLAAHNPYSGRIALGLMRALEAAGDHGSAIRHAHVHEALLQEELGAEPDSDVLELAERLKAKPSGASPPWFKPEPDGAPAVTGPVAQEGTGMRGKSWLPWATSTAALVLIAVIGGSRLLRPDAEPPDPERTSAPTLVPNRILVAPFENETGDSELDPLGRILADWVTEGLAQTGLVEVVDSRAVLFSLQELEAEAELPISRSLNQALAELTRAATIVSGSYYRQGDSLLIRGQVIDAKSRSLLRTVASSSIATADPMDAIEKFRSRVQGALATLLDGRLASETTLSSRPPTFEAYRAFTEGMDLFGRHEYGDALPLFYRAAELDSTFVLPLLWASEAHIYDVPTDPFHADSLIRHVEASRQRLSPVDRHGLDYLLARRTGDRAAVTQALRRASSLAPQSYWSFMWASDLWENGRYKEAQDLLSEFDPVHSWVKIWRRYWSIYTSSYHSVGDYRQERQVALGGQEAFPDAAYSYAYELRALAALGEVEEVLAGVERIIDRFGDSWGVSTMQLLIPELRAHGYPDESRALAERCIERINELVETLTPEEVREKGLTVYSLGMCMRWAGRPARARTLAEQALAADDFQAWDSRSRYVGRLSILAAERGDRAEADRYLQEYLQEFAGQPRPEGAPPPGLLTQAKIAAALRDRERAMSLLRRHLAEGSYVRDQLHRMTAFESLWDYPPFQQLVGSQD